MKFKLMKKSKNVRIYTVDQGYKARPKAKVNYRSDLYGAPDSRRRIAYGDKMTKALRK